MFHKIAGINTLIEETIQRLDDCDELLLLRAFKKMAHTEIAAIVSILPMQYANQVMIILPYDMAKRVVGCGFNNKKPAAAVLRKFLAAVDREVDLILMQTVRMENKADRLVTQQQKNLETSSTENSGQGPFEHSPNESESDRISSASMAVLDTLSRLIGNSFRKH